MTKQTRAFETEVTQLLHLMIHSLYSNKEIFLRELISNASDAADKLRFEALQNPALYEQEPELGIWLSYDKDAKTLTIRDNGIGMTQEDTIAHLGTIAHSGTKAFLKNLNPEHSKDANLIGQFGVGFYASFMVSDEVVVKTRRAGQPVETGTCWKSKGDGEYTVENMPIEARGTEITLHLKADAEEFLSDIRLTHLVTHYSDHIGIPIHLKKEGEDNDTIINRATALWALPKSDITDEQYQAFYQHLSHDYENPLAWTHNRVEGKTEYVSLLYIPAKQPFDLWDPKHTRGLKLYVRRVFIMDDAEQLLPRYLRFVRGIIDSNDLPLNVSREILQSSRVVDTIRQGVVKRILSLLKTLATDKPDQYAECWKNFGTVLKEGPGEDFNHKEEIAGLLRFASTMGENADTLISLTEYKNRMKEGQTKIYYCTADSYMAAKHSPHLESFQQNGLEVLLLTDRVDEWLMAHLTEFEGLPFQSVARGSLEDGKKVDETVDKTFEASLARVKTLLQDQVKDVRLTQRLTQSPACIVADDSGMNLHMERILRSMGQTVESKPILELNPTHPLVQLLQTEANESRFVDLSHLLLEQAIVAEGGQLPDPGTFVKRVNRWLTEAL